MDLPPIVDSADLRKCVGENSILTDFTDLISR